MNIHEHQAKEVLRRFGAPVMEPPGKSARTTSTGSGWTACTPCVFWAVIAVIAVIP